jgi:hypothetical protein
MHTQIQLLRLYPTQPQQVRLHPTELQSSVVSLLLQTSKYGEKHHIGGGVP